MRILVEGGVDVNARYSNGNTALIWAADRGHLEVVRFLVENAADVNARGRGHRTALGWAIRDGHAAVVDYLRSVGAEE